MSDDPKSARQYQAVRVLGLIERYRLAQSANCNQSTSWRWCIQLAEKHRNCSTWKMEWI